MITTSNGNERKWTISFPKFGNRKEIKKAKFGNEKGLKKSSFRIFGNGNRNLSFLGMAWNENGNGKKTLTGNITKIWEQEGKALSPFPKIGNGKGREQ